MRFLSSLKQKINCYLRDKHVILKIKHDWGEEGSCIFCGRTVYKITNFQNVESSDVEKRRVK
jgi:hypothetical protein